MTACENKTVSPTPTVAHNLSATAVPLHCESDSARRCRHIYPPRTPSTVMSHTHPTATLSSNFQPIFNNALKAYERHTKKDLLAHPLAAQLQACDSPSSILAVLQQQVQDLNRSQSSNERLTKWLDPTVSVLYAFSETLGEGVSLVCSPI